jgi:hypothetical protein
VLSSASLNDPPHVSPVPANPCAPTRKAGTITPRAGRQKASSEETSS